MAAVLSALVASLDEFDAALRLVTFTKERLAQYVARLSAQDKRDLTIQRHCNFLRECHRLAGRAQPPAQGHRSSRGLGT